jgi:hypothetical protein
VVQEPTNKSNGQAAVSIVEFHSMIDGALYEGDVYTRRTVNFETSFKGISSITISGMSGQSENIIPEYVCDVDTSGSKPSFAHNGGTYYFDASNLTSFVGRVIQVYKSTTFVNSNLAEFTVTGYSLQGGQYKVLINYMSFNAGSSAGVLYLQSSNGLFNETTKSKSAFKLTSALESASNNYTIVSNMGSSEAPLTSASNATVFGGEVYEANIAGVKQRYYPSLLNYELDPEEHQDIYDHFGVTYSAATGYPHKVVLGVYLVYTLYRCYSSDLYTNESPAPINIYIANVSIGGGTMTGYCFIEAYKKNIEGKRVSRLELLKDNSGTPITYEMLFGALGSGQTNINLQYLFGSYQEQTVIKYDASTGKYYLKTSVDSGSYTYYFYDKGGSVESGKFVKCPLVGEAPVSIECKVVGMKKLGSHIMIMAKVLSIDADDKYIDKKGAFDISKCDLIAYANGGYYALGKKLGTFGYSVKKKSTVKNTVRKNSSKVAGKKDTKKPAKKIVKTSNKKQTKNKKMKKK